MTHTRFPLLRRKRSCKRKLQAMKHHQLIFSANVYVQVVRSYIHLCMYIANQEIEKYNVVKFEI